MIAAVSVALIFAYILSPARRPRRYTWWERLKENDNDQR